MWALLIESHNVLGGEAKYQQKYTEWKDYPRTVVKVASGLLGPMVNY
jgi:hypothetical protein